MNQSLKIAAIYLVKCSLKNVGLNLNDVCYAFTSTVGKKMCNFDPLQRILVVLQRVLALCEFH